MIRFFSNLKAANDSSIKALILCSCSVVSILAGICHTNHLSDSITYEKANSYITKYRAGIALVMIAIVTVMIGLYFLNKNFASKSLNKKSLFAAVLAIVSFNLIYINISKLNARSKVYDQAFMNRKYGPIITRDVALIPDDELSCFIELEFGRT